MARPSYKVQHLEVRTRELEGLSELDEEVWADASDQDPPAPRVARPSSDGRPGERAERAHRLSVQSEAMQYTNSGGPYPSTVVPAERWGHRGLVGRPIEGGGVQRPVDQRSTRGQGEACELTSITDFRNSKVIFISLRMFKF